MQGVGGVSSKGYQLAIILSVNSMSFFTPYDIKVGAIQSSEVMYTSDM